MKGYSKREEADKRVKSERWLKIERESSPLNSAWGAWLKVGLHSDSQKRENGRKTGTQEGKEKRAYSKKVVQEWEWVWQHWSSFFNSGRFIGGQWRQVLDQRWIFEPLEQSWSDWVTQEVKREEVNKKGVMLIHWISFAAIIKKTCFWKWVSEKIDIKGCLY